MRPEEKIEKSNCEYAFSKGLLPLKMSIPGRRGYPDRQFFMHLGYSFFIEYKTPSGSLSPHQVEKIGELRERGFTVYVVDNIEEGKAVVDREIAKLKMVTRIAKGPNEMAKYYVETNVKGAFLIYKGKAFLDMHEILKHLVDKDEEIEKLREEIKALKATMGASIC